MTEPWKGFFGEGDKAPLWVQKGRGEGVRGLFMARWPGILCRLSIIHCTPPGCAFSWLEVVVYAVSAGLNPLLQLTTSFTVISYPCTSHSLHKAEVYPSCYRPNCMSVFAKRLKYNTACLSWFIPRLRAGCANILWVRAIERGRRSFIFFTHQHSFVMLRNTD